MEKYIEEHQRRFEQAERAGCAMLTIIILIIVFILIVIYRSII